MINTAKLEAYCLRYNKIERWEHIVQCKDMKIINEAFVLDLEIKLKKANKENQNSEKNSQIVWDISKFLLK